MHREITLKGFRCIALGQRFQLALQCIFTIAITSSVATQGAAEEEASPTSASSESVLSESFIPPGRLLVNSQAVKESSSLQADRLLIYALPNGNTIEQTLGCKMSPGLDWHYDIQHVAAQVRLLRELVPDERLVLACAEADGLSWPTYRKQPGANARIAALADDWRTRFAGETARVTLAGHSGGGSFIFGVIEGADEIPAYIDRIAILDANYAYDAALHEAKLVRWLEGDPARRLIVLAYDDREITFEGKKVVGPTGGTYRATERMVESLGKHFPLTKTDGDPFIEYTGLDGRIHFYVHKNPQNKILHTALVGDMNGLVHAQTLGGPQEETWGKFGGPRAYTKFIQAEPTLHPPPRYSGEGLGEGPRSESGAPAPKENPSPSPSLQGRGIPARPADAVSGRAFMQRIARLDRAAREAAILKELAAGNVPEFLRTFKPVPINATDAAGKKLAGVIEVMPDYLAVGSDEDFVRVPMTPQTAQALADQLGCTLPTRKMVDAIDAAAEVRLAPQPLTEDRESVAAFLLSNEKIEAQRTNIPLPRREGASEHGRPKATERSAVVRAKHLGEGLLGALTIGAKKDVVLSPRIHERPDRVAIYGWRQLDGTPIQPLTTVHVNWYVDYSHGIRLVRDEMQLDGQPTKISDLLRDPDRSLLLSDEGPIDPPRYLDK